MNKIRTDILLDCNSITCCMNELIVLPATGEVGFEEYFNHKAASVHEARPSFSKLEERKLILTYPTPPTEKNMTDKLFPLFFESPTVVAHNQDFTGCFGIDITGYIHNTNSDKFLDLMAYMQSHHEITFVLFVYTDNTNESTTMFNAVSQYVDIRLVHIPLPDATQLSIYTCDGIRDFCLNIDPTVEDYLQVYYSQHNYGYDAANYLIRVLKNSQYSGDLNTLIQILSNTANSFTTNTELSGFGY